MQSSLFLFLFIAFLFFSCNKDEKHSQYPQKFVFQKSNITNEKGYVIGDNESYIEIDSKSGNLNILRAALTADLFGYIRRQGFGTYVESIELLSKDSIRLNTWENGKVNSYNFGADVENINGEIIDTNLLGYTIIWDKSNQELRYRFAVITGILDRSGISSPFTDYNFSTMKDVSEEFQNFLLNANYKINDTLGIYLLDMIYK